MPAPSPAPLHSSAVKFTMTWLDVASTRKTGALGLTGNQLFALITVKSLTPLSPSACMSYDIVASPLGYLALWYRTCPPEE
jgi:hypothetical protein